MAYPFTKNTHFLWKYWRIWEIFESKVVFACNVPFFVTTKINLEKDIVDNFWNKFSETRFDKTEILLISDVQASLRETREIIPSFIFDRTKYKNEPYIIETFNLKSINENKNFNTPYGFNKLLVKSKVFYNSPYNRGIITHIPVCINLSQSYVQKPKFRSTQIEIDVRYAYEKIYAWT